MGEPGSGRRSVSPRDRGSGGAVASPPAQSQMLSEQRSLPTERRATLGPAEVAWIALIPFAAVGLLAIVLLGPPLGHALFAPGSDRLWPPGWWEAQGTPEPVKQGRYVIAALAPMLLAAAVFAGSRRRLELRPEIGRAVAYASYALVLALVAVALLNQRSVIVPTVPAPPLFGLGDVLAAATLVLVATVALRNAALAARIADLVRETRTRRVAGLVVAVVFVAIWLLKSVMTDRLVGDVGGFNLPWTLNDALAVTNGRTPLVDYHAIYSKLLPYATSAVLSTFGATTLTYTVFMAFLTGLTLLAVYAVFRLLTRSSLLALGLFLPFVAVSDLGGIPIAAGVVSPLTLSAMWPMRYGGVFLLAWLVARHVAGRSPRRAWVIFLVGGLVAINALEFGVGAIAATVVTLLCARPPRSVRAALRLAAHVAGGALAAVVLVSAFTLLRAGELPRPALLLEWPRIFGTLGWFSIPLPTLGLHLAVYATFAAAVVVAAVRWSRRDDDVLLTSMLTWSGVFGLLAGSYFIGRPDVLKLSAILAAWSFALAPLTIVCVRALAARGWRRPTLPQLLVLFGFALSVCSLSQLSPPWQQIDRLTSARPAPTYEPSATRFVRERTQRGETVAILIPMGFRIAQDLGLRNIAPFPFMNAIVTRSQMQVLIDAVQREDVRTIVTPAPGNRLLDEGDAAREQLQLLVDAGFSPTSVEARLIELSRP
jgi:hypothetical protein